MVFGNNMSKNRCKEIERWIVKNANVARKKRGISPLRTNTGLMRVARNHSRNMARNKRLWHGNGVYIARHSLSIRSLWDLLKCFFYSGMSGENVGLMFTGNVRSLGKIKSNKDIAHAQHRIWMRSSGHRKNMMNPNFKLIGVGVVKRGKGYYCTQLFYG